MTKRLTVAELDVPGVRARRLAQVGSRGKLWRFISKACPSDRAGLSVDLLLHELAGDGNLTSLCYWSEQLRPSQRFKPDSFATAALNGHADVVKWMLQTHPSAAVVTPALAKQVAALGHRSVMEVLVEHVPLSDEFGLLTVEIQETDQAGDAAVAPRAPPLHSIAATNVLLDTSLWLRISSLKPRPVLSIERLAKYLKKTVAAEEQRGVLMRLALMYCDLETVKQVYAAAQSTWFEGPRKLSLDTAMHDAAVEGRLNALAWLHVQLRVAPCRPHTMASAVRTGRPDVVRWLHANAPESALSMSASPLVDAARWGFLDVLTTCHELKIPYEMIDIRDRTAWRQAALDVAITHSQWRVMRWLLREFALVISPDATKRLFKHGKQHVMQFRDEIKSLSRDSVDVATAEIATTPSHSALVEFVVTHRLLSDSGAQQVAEQILQRECSKADAWILRTLLAHYTSIGGSVLLSAVALENESALHVVLDSATLSPQSVIEALQAAVSDRRTKVLPALVGHSLRRHIYDGVLPLLSSYGKLSFVQDVFPHRTSEDAIEALELATTREVASFLVRHEDKYFTEAILLDKIPACMGTPFIRYLLKHGRSQEAQTVANFARVLEEDHAPLAMAEIEAVRLLQDPQMDELVRRSFESIVVTDTETTDHSLPGVLEYLRSIGVTPPPQFLDGAIERGRLEEVEWLVTGCGVSVEGITASCVRSAASKASHTAVIEYLHRQDASKSSHGLRLGIRLAFEDALAAHDDISVARLQNVDADDLSPLRMALVADEGQAALVRTLAQSAPAEAVVDALWRASERRDWRVVEALLDAQPRIEIHSSVRVQLASSALRADNLELAKRLASGATP